MIIFKYSILGSVLLMAATSIPTHRAPQKANQLIRPKITANKCKTGKQQSPVDLRWSPALGVEEVLFLYVGGPVTVKNTGELIKVEFDKGNFVSLNSRHYTLKEVIVHAPSEHTLSGKRFPLEFQMIHEDHLGNRIAVGIFGVVGTYHQGLAPVISGAPIDDHRENYFEGVFFNPAKFLPGNLNHYSYVGSLTAPPCEENVNWKVMNTPIELAAEQVEYLTELHSGKIRPIQKRRGNKPVVLYGAYQN